MNNIQEELEKLILIDNLPYTVIAKQFEVSDLTIRKNNNENKNATVSKENNVINNNFFK